jgi:hypothetical protein
MKTPRFILAGSLLAALLSTLLSLPLAAAPAKEEVLIDFTDVRRERDGTTTKNYEWASGDWEKHIIDMPRRGCLIQSPTGKGNLGENKTMVEFNKSTIATMVFVIGNANQAKAINLVLEDSDGTEQSWAISFEGLDKGKEYHFPLDLTKCTHENKPGTKPGLNLKKIASWNINGGWTEPNLEVLLIKLVAPKL